MSYPSFLWSGELTPDTEREPSTPETTLEDLIGDKEIRARSLPLLRCPCSGAEIAARQQLFRAMLDEAGFEEKIRAIEEQISETERLYGELERAETEEEKVLLFLPLMIRFFDVAREIAGLDSESGRAGEIGGYWRGVIDDPTVKMTEKRCRDVMAKRDDAVKLTIHGWETHIWERRDGMRDKLEKMLRDMGMEDAIPQGRQPARALPSVVGGYADVYNGYYGMAESFWKDYSTRYLGGEDDLAPLFLYLPELHFMIDCTAYFKTLREAGYPLTYPEVTSRREFILSGVVDPSLHRRGIPGTEVVPNDLEMRGDKLNFYILSGANGGGKTTFLRACSLAALFFSVGCPIAARSGRGMPFDAVYTHFPSNESFENSGRFADESARADEILAAATENSFAVFNETYSGTDEKRSEEYSAKLAHAMFDAGVFGIYVTHIHSLTGGEIPTLAAMIDEADENRRTYKIRRVGGTSSSFARDILEKYGLDSDSLEKKLDKMKGGA